MTQAEQIVDYLWSVGPVGATNGQITRALGIRSQQTVYMVTQDLLRRSLIWGEQVGRTWRFYALDTPEVQLSPASSGTLTRPIPTRLTAAEFETWAGEVMRRHYGVNRLAQGQVGNVPKRFDFVSTDQQIVGDAKYYTRVGGAGLPPAKFSVIAEHVWLLEKTGAREKFLVFGNDRQVPVRWLERYGGLVTGVAFYFLSDDGQLESLT